MSFLLYLVGLAVLLGGLVWAAVAMGVPELYIAIGATILFGMGIMSAVAQTRRRDSGGTEETTVVKTER